VGHARYVGLRTLPEPARPSVARRVAQLPARYDRAVDRRITTIGGVLVAALLAGLVIAGTFAGARTSDAAALASPSAAATSAPVALAPLPSSLQQPSPGPSPTPGPTLTLLPTGYRWPLDQGRITTAFGPEAGGLFYVDGVAFHDGIDIASFCGDRVVAAHDGVVIASGRHVEQALGWVGDVAGYEAHITAKQLWGGLAVMVITDDGNGYRSVYVHLYQSLVKVGQHLAAGDLLGWEGRTGDATGCHLHYSIFSPTDPGRFITDPKLVRKSDLPAAEIARIDPLTVLPPMSTTEVTWGWGAKPSNLP
jgi:murein DD-endopeptidase MepM/ murein hydrolase activator NlpD